MTLWIVLAAMAVCAAVPVALPLWRRSGAGESRDAHVLEVYRDQLDGIASDLERGSMSAEQAEAARTEIGRRALALETAVPPAAVRPPSRLAVVAGVTAAVAVPLAAFAVYLGTGSPGLSSRTASEVPPQLSAIQAGEDGDRERVEILAAALEKAPDDLRSWAALGDALVRLRRYPQAAVAYGHAARLAPRQAAYPALTGVAMTLAAGGRVTPEAVAAFDAALRRDPGEARARYYLGLADFQAGRAGAALARWRSLEAAAPQDAAWLGFLRQRIAALEARAGDPAAEGAGAADRE